MDDLEGSGATPASVKVCRQGLHPLFALLAAVCLLGLVGWTGEVTGWQHRITTLTGIVFALERGWVFHRMRSERGERRRLAYHAALAALVLVVALVLLFGGGRSIPGHVFIQLAVLASGLASAIHHQPRLTARAFHPGLVLILSFLAIIVAGTLLLRMPRCTVSGDSCSWLDAAFTSTSAVCVTGLAVQNTATFFSPTGQAVILLLIQVGGLGIMTLAFFAAVVLFEGISLHDRLLLGRMLQENRLARVGQTLSFIITLTFACEAVGAVILYAGMDGIASSGERWFHAVFHSVSAFCNAGFSTLPDGLASTVVQGNGLWQIVIMALIVIGGLGALVCEDLALWSMAKIRRHRRKEGPNPRLRVHTRLVLVVTAALIVGGAVVIYGTEYLFWQGPENGGRVLSAFFHSVTTRTAGFNTVSMSAIGPLTAQMMMLLMLIGGSPGGTAGGLRTTTVAVGLGHLWNQLRGGKRGMVAFNRTIPATTGSQALGLIVLAGIWLSGNFIVLQMLEAGRGIAESTLLFELISGFATVGLSLDLTPSLTDGSKCLLVVNMFVGRIGLLTVLATFLPPDRRPASGKPCEDILLT
jgi:Trk-type K+ transport system membrane component